MKTEGNTNISVADVLSVEARWKLREESAKALAERLGCMLQALQTVHRGFPLLMWTGGPMRALYPVPAVADEYIPLFIPTRVYDEAHKRRFSDGFAFTADARLSDRRFIQLHIDAGKHVDCGEQVAWPNVVSIATVIHDPWGADRAILEALKPTLTAVIAAWQPERAGAFSRSLAAHTHQPARPSFYNGVLAAYLRRELAAEVTIPSEAFAEPLAAGGLLLAVTDRCFNITDPIQQRTGAALREALTAAEL